jgi:hypothetical protein
MYDTLVRNELLCAVIPISFSVCAAYLPQDRSNLSAVLLLLEGLDAASLAIVMTKCHKLIAAQEGEE